MRWFVFFALALGAVAAPAQQKQFRIQFAEKVQLDARVGHREFDAYGRRFSLELERNERLLANLPGKDRAQLANLQLLRGKLDGAPRSWVRLTRVESGLEGAIWDGNDLYVVTTLGRIAKNLTTPLDATPSQTVVYRLSDTLDGLPEAFCGLVEDRHALPQSKITGLRQYQALVTQLSAMAPASQLDIALVADTSFQQANTNPRDSMLSRLNTVDGIFFDQLGVLLSPTEFRLVAANADPFTATDASQLLQQLSNYRKQTPSLLTPGLVHLMTNKDLDGNTIGIAFLDSLCDPGLGVSLSNSEMGFLGSALVMAHEIGHNFGAEHDGAAGGACADAPDGYLMSPTFNGSSRFSQCSLGTLTQSIARARDNSCLVAPRYADLAVESPAYVDALIGEAFTVPVTVKSLGNIAAVDAKLRLTLPQDVGYQSATLTNGSCSLTGNQLVCSLGDLPANTNVPVALTLTSTRTSGASLEFSVTADNDNLQYNQTAQTGIRFSTAIDLSAAMTASAASIYVNDNIDLTIDISSLRSQPARGGRLFVSYNGLQFDSADAGAHTCSEQSGQVNCNLADVPSGTTTRIVLHLRGRHRGPTMVEAVVQVAGDGNSDNNVASAPVVVMPENDLALATSQESLSFVTGTMQQVTFTVSASGRIPAVNAQLLVLTPWNAVLDSVVPSAGTCTGPSLYICEFGDLAPGAVRTVVVRFHTTEGGGSTLQAESRFNLDPNQVWTSAIYTQLYSNLQIDVVASSIRSDALEGQPRAAYMGVESVGLQPAQNVVATLTVPSQVRLTEVSSIPNDSNWSCSVATPQRVRCTGAFASRGGVTIAYTYVSDVPGSYPATLVVSATGDQNAANNTSSSMLEILPFIDVGISTAQTGELQLVAGEDRTVAFTVTTGNRAVPGVTFNATAGPAITALNAGGATCAIVSTSNGRCELGNLPANASIPVSVTYRSSRDNELGTVTVGVSTALDRNTQNNLVRFPFVSTAYTDLRLAAAASSATAVSGQTLRLPLVSLVNGLYPARNASVEIPLPTFATVAQISGSGVNCMGTGTLICEFGTIEAGTTRTLDITLQTSGTGTFTSNIRLQSANDLTTANNTVAVALSVTASSSGGGGSSGGSGGTKTGGGGGRFEWLALAFLALLAVNRARRSAGKPALCRAIERCGLRH